MKKILNTFKSLSKRLKATLVFAFICLLALALYFAFGSEQLKNGDVAINEVIVDGLPNLSMIDADENPVMYDFVNSSISYKMNVNPSKWGFYFAIMQSSKDPSKAYVEYYTYGEKITFPSLGTRPEPLTLSKSQQDAVHDFSIKLSDERVYVEGDWKMFIVSQWNDGQESEFNYCDNVGRWAGIDLTPYISGEIGNMQMVVESGFGWPIEWLRKEPYRETMRFEGYDVSDTFWDRYNIKSFKIYKRNGNDELKVEVAQLDRFKIKINGGWVSLNERQLNEYLKKEGWE